MRIFSLITGCFASTLPLVAHANNGDSDMIDPCITNDLSCATDLATYIDIGITPTIITAFGGILFAMLIFYGFKLAVESKNDSALADTARAYTQALIGAVLVMGAWVLSSSFGQVGVVDPIGVEVGIIAHVIAYVIKIVGAVLILNIVIQGIRMISSVNEGGVDSARRNLIQSFVGAAIVMISKTVFEAIQPGAFSGAINNEIVGIANFLATIFGVFVVLAIIVAGIMLIVSVNESLKDRARTIIITALVSLIVVMTSVGLIRILLPT